MRYYFIPTRTVSKRNKKNSNDKCWQGWGGIGNPCPLLVGMQNGSATVVDIRLSHMTQQCHSVQFSSVAQSSPTLCNPMNRSNAIRPKIIENKCSNKNLSIVVLFIMTRKRKNANVRHRWMDKQDMVHTCNRILFMPPEEWGADTCYNADEPWKHDAQCKKPDPEGHVGGLHMWGLHVWGLPFVQNRWMHGDRRQISLVARGWRRKEWGGEVTPNWYRLLRMFWNSIG